MKKKLSNLINNGKVRVSNALLTKSAGDQSFVAVIVLIIVVIGIGVLFTTLSNGLFNNLFQKAETEIMGMF